MQTTGSGTLTRERHVQPRMCSLACRPQAFLPLLVALKLFFPCLCVPILRADRSRRLWRPAVPKRGLSRRLSRARPPKYGTLASAVRWTHRNGTIRPGVRRRLDEPPDSSRLVPRAPPSASHCPKASPHCLSTPQSRLTPSRTLPRLQIPGSLGFRASTIRARKWNNAAKKRPARDRTATPMSGRRESRRDAFHQPLGQPGETTNISKLA